MSIGGTRVGNDNDGSMDGDAGGVSYAETKPERRETRRGGVGETDPEPTFRGDLGREVLVEIFLLTADLGGEECLRFEDKLGGEGLDGKMDHPSVGFMEMGRGWGCGDSNRKGRFLGSWRPGHHGWRLLGGRGPAGGGLLAAGSLSDLGAIWRRR